MSRTVKKSNLVELEESNRDLEDNFTWVGLNLPDMMLNKDLLENHHNKENLATVAQSETTSPNSCDFDYYKDDIDDSANLEKDLLEEKYWNQFGTKDKLNSKPKYPTLQRTKQRESDFTTFRQTNSKEQEERKLSFLYKLDKTTTLTLQRLLDIRSLGQDHKIIGKEKSKWKRQSNSSKVSQKSTN